MTPFWGHDEERLTDLSGNTRAGAAHAGPAGPGRAASRLAQPGAETPAGRIPPKRLQIRHAGAVVFHWPAACGSGNGGPRRGDFAPHDRLTQREDDVGWTRIVIAGGQVPKPSPVACAARRSLVMKKKRDLIVLAPPTIYAASRSGGTLRFARMYVLPGIVRGNGPVAQKCPLSGTPNRS